MSAQSIELVFPLKEVTPEFKTLVSQINILHPDFTLGGNMTRRSQNSKDITLNIPKLKFKAKFRVEPTSKISGLITVFNLMCSLHDCVVIFVIDEEKHQLNITIVSGNSDTYNLLQEVYDRVT